MTTIIIAAFLFSPSALEENPHENIDKSKEGDMIMQAKTVKNAKDLTNQSAGAYEG